MLNLNPKDDDKCQTLNAYNGTGGNNMPLVYENHSQDTRYKELGDVCTTVSATFGMGGNNTPFVVENSQVSTDEPTVYEWYRRDTRATELGDVCTTVQASYGTGGNNMPMVMENCSWDGGQISPTLTANNANGAQRMPDKENFNAILGFDSYNLQDTGDVGRCLSAAGGGINEHAPCVYENDNNQYKGDTTMKQTAIVRRLTPTECSRLQGMPDGWCDIGEWVDEKGKKHKDADAPKYKALGNGIALPFWQWLMYRVNDQLRADGVETPTLASLFDGIGSFPLAFTRAGGKALWTSEIEPYPIAVCKKHFGDEETGEVGDVEKYL
jgi:site-specific DNA-cytosine methylase